MLRPPSAPLHRGRFPPGCHTIPAIFPPQLPDAIVGEPGLLRDVEVSQRVLRGAYVSVVHRVDGTLPPQLERARGKRRDPPTKKRRNLVSIAGGGEDADDAAAERVTRLLSC